MFPFLSRFYPLPHLPPCIPFSNSPSVESLRLYSRCTAIRFTRIHAESSTLAVGGRVASLVSACCPRAPSMASAECAGSGSAQIPPPRQAGIERRTQSERLRFHPLARRAQFWERSAGISWRAVRLCNDLSHCLAAGRFPQRRNRPSVVDPRPPSADSLLLLPLPPRCSRSSLCPSAHVYDPRALQCERNNPGE